MRKIVSALAAAGLILGLLAPSASAGFNPFKWSILLGPSGNNQHSRVLVKTIGGNDAPKRVSLRSEGKTAKAKQKAGSSSRWVVTDRTARGDALIGALTSEIDESGSVTLNGVASYACGSRFKYSFEIEHANRRAEPQFKDAAVCL